MVEVQLYNGKTWFIDSKLKLNLDILISDVLFNDMDLVLAIDGEEGSGKSFAARAIAFYIATVAREAGFNIDFSPDNVHFSREDYIASSKASGNFTINIMDESRESVARNSKDKSIKAFIDWISFCRYKRQFHIFLVPRYHDLHPYIGQTRARALINFKKNYQKDAKTISGLRLKLGEFKLYCDRHGLQFNHFYRTYKYPNNWDAWNWFSNKETFSDEQLIYYLAKKKFYAERTQEQKKENFDFEKFKNGLAGAELYTHLQEYIERDFITSDNRNNGGSICTTTPS